MSVEIDKTTIITFKGDTCQFTFTDLQEGMVIYLGVRDKKTNMPVFEDLHETVNSEGEVTFELTPAMTNKFVVKPLDGFAIYYYGIKQVNEEIGEENTILLGENPRFSDKYLIKVYLKKAEGIVEEDD